MKRIRIGLWACLLIPTLLWALTQSLPASPWTWFSTRPAVLQLTGILAILTMSAAMVLALRPKPLEALFDGLDKMYRLHRWLGISALVLSLLHWWWAQGTKWMVGWGWLERPARHGAGAPPNSTLEQWFRSQRGLAEDVGEWAFYAAAALIVVALLRRVPYRWFAWSHRWISVAFLVLVFHSIVLLRFQDWGRPIGWLVAVALAAGSVAALIALSRRIGAGRRVRGRIETLQWYPGLQVLETSIRLAPGWPGHRAGQFAFVTSQPKEGAHPYTIASAWDTSNPQITFITKSLGDHTRTLHDRLKPGMDVTVEGPYGRFDFEDDKPRQIWIGAGIGITPFVARMKQRAHARDARRVDLFHPTHDTDPAALAKLEADAQAAGVTLHLLVSPRDGRLDAQRIRTAVPDWRQASLWFCGPAAFGESLERDFVSAGLAPADFHRELFEMR